MIYAIFFKETNLETTDNDKEIESENIHSQFIEYVPRKGESVEVLEVHHIVKDVHYHIDETETYVQILLEEIEDQCK